ncbi:MAG: hypothetical protein A3G35_05630 [candidate division NC10 bacterium RIFCSPLOWO2_12_FULL_66_18]|jgi:hypothetical protein|nr:cupredoxin domain-containing protein [candidate division NC10 bacterium]OGC02473.1 MAG: hypothetical protein A3G35_05630 [candidate division NC10 bacterium RIFCSPLOWO2_12_FULL_66_18]
MTSKGAVAGRPGIVASALAVVGMLTLVLVLPQVGMGQAADERVVYMSLIEPKGGVTVDKEPFPGTQMPKGGGYVLNPPNPQGRWEVSVYQFSPATVVVRQGERVTLEMVGINGAKHSVHIDKYVPNHAVVKRGEIGRVKFTADTPGIYKIHCEEHQPSMEGTLVVLPR